MESESNNFKISEKGDFFLTTPDDAGWILSKLEERGKIRRRIERV